jgi:5-methylcytosine-specific restriction endonuclease McrA
MVTLLDPERCRDCGVKGQVIDSRMCIWYRRRRHRCPKCRARWSSFESLVNPNVLTHEQLTDANDEPVFEYVGDPTHDRPLRASYSKNWDERAAFYKSDEWRVAKESVLARANQRCERCGVDRDTVNQERGRFHIHHVVPFHKAPELRAAPSNLILLCNECHRFVHSRANVDGLYLQSSHTTA